MHLLAAQAGAIVDSEEPVDLGQTPSDIVFLSAADTELAALSAARETMENPPGLRLANLSHLRHPMSVDLHLDKCATRSRLVIARILGGKGYWSYGLEQYASRLGEAGVFFAALPGDDKPDEELLRHSSVAPEIWHRLWAYLVEGGPENSAGLLRFAGWVLDGQRNDSPPEARPLLKAGLYWPGKTTPDLDVLRRAWTPGAPGVPLVFYRALLQGAGLQPINRLVRALLRRGLNPMPVFVASLKDPVSVASLDHFMQAEPPDVILNCTGFAVGSPQGDGMHETPFSAPSANGAQVLQVVLSGGSEAAWIEGTAGLSSHDIAMNVALPEIDGRVLSRAISFKDEAYFDEATQCPVASYRARGDRVDFVADLAAGWSRLRRAAAGERRVALILANYPNKDGRLANGVGLDTPASTVAALRLLSEAGYDVRNLPADSDALIRAILDGPTNWLSHRVHRKGGVCMPLDDYRRAYARLPLDTRMAVEERWGQPEDDPYAAQDGFALSILRFGNVTVGVQPARGYNIDPRETYHAPDLAPPHHYIAFYLWLRTEFEAHAIVHMGKHGNLEWLPGKALALSAACFPEAVLGPMPHVYPFIVNDPGEGTQAKRRAQAVIIDHLTPPLTRAETYGPLKDLEALVDEYYDAQGVDPRRAAHLKSEIIDLMSATGLDRDAGIEEEDAADESLVKLDAYLCDLKEAQIRDGLHVLGQSPEGDQARDLLQAILRLRRGNSPAQQSLIRALAEDNGVDIDPLDCDLAAIYTGPRAAVLVNVSTARWRSNGDTVERLELLASRILDDRADAAGPASELVLEDAVALRTALAACGPSEGSGLLTALNGRFVAPAPSGAPTRGRPDVLPTGRNFFSVDTRAVPTSTAWTLGWASANLLVERHLQDHGDWPRAFLISAWGTANMRTGGDDIAQALALIGARPTWDAVSRRVTGFEILPLSILGRPRIDVTLRVSGFFRDAFPGLIDLFDAAARAVMALDEPVAENPSAARFHEDQRAGRSAEEAGYRVFGSKPGAYGAGLQALIDERIWTERADLGDTWLEWGSYAYGVKARGARARDALTERMRRTDGIVHNQDNREHDLLDSDDYYQFEGGAAAAAASLQGRDVTIYHNDHSRPERPVIRTLEEEIGRVVRSRVVNPKWIAGVMRHGYKGAFEMAATVDYLFAFSATTRAVRGHHFDLVYQAYLEDDVVRSFIETHNAPALREIAERLGEAIVRGLWTPRSNSARAMLERLSDG